MKLVGDGAKLRCTMGNATSRLTVAPGRPTDSAGARLATVIDHATGVNLASFGDCRSPANPTVATATAAANGVLTPMPCLPAVASAWTAGAPRADFQGTALLTDACRCACTWAGVISVEAAGCDAEVEV